MQIMLFSLLVVIVFMLCGGLFLFVKLFLESKADSKNKAIKINEMEIEFLTRLSEAQSNLKISENQLNELSKKEAQFTEQDIDLRALIAKNSTMTAELEAAHLNIKNITVTMLELQQIGAQKNEEIRQLSNTLAALQMQISQEKEMYQQKVQLLQDAKETLALQFKDVAAQILQDNSAKFIDTNQTSMATLLQPLQQHLTQFDQMIKDKQNQSTQDRIDLVTELKILKTLNQDLGKEAHALTQAITGGNNKQQGIWGEMILEKILEASGLEKNREYRVQVSSILEADTGNKRYQPDVILELPDQKQLVIDAKVSLNAYTRYINADDKSEQDKHLKEHINALRQHVKSLSEKRYQDLYGLDTLEFVFIFIPVEPAYLAALKADPQLYLYAFEQKIMLVCPSTLMATLRTIDTIWRYERQNKNALEIANQGAKLYEKFFGLMTTFDKINKQLDTVKASFNTAHKQLSEGSGNLIGQVEKLRELGVKTNKKLSIDRSLDQAIENMVERDDTQISA